MPPAFTTTPRRSATPGPVLTARPQQPRILTTASKPLACRNVALTADNLIAWRDELKVIDADLAARPLLPPLLQAQLERRRDDVRAHLDRYDKEHP